ncbi:MAG: hypothetical protein WC319_00380 [Candidatus Paceibacterota bacterium]
MTSELFKIVTGLLLLIMIVATTLSVNYLWYFFIGDVVTFILSVWLINKEKLIVISAFSAILIFMCWSAGLFGNVFILKVLPFAITGCFAPLIIRRAWLSSISIFQ